MGKVKDAVVGKLKNVPSEGSSARQHHFSVFLAFWASFSISFVWMTTSIYLYVRALLRYFFICAKWCEVSETNMAKPQQVTNTFVCSDMFWVHFSSTGNNNNRERKPRCTWTKPGLKIPKPLSDTHQIHMFIYKDSFQCWWKRHIVVGSRKMLFSTWLQSGALNLQPSRNKANAVYQSISTSACTQKTNTHQLHPATEPTDPISSAVR